MKGLLERWPRNPISFLLGGIYSVRRAEEELTPAILDAVEALAEDIDLALFVPV